LSLLGGRSEVARESDCTMAQAALAWVLAQGPHIIPIPGTTRLDHLEENARADGVRLSPAALARLNALINPSTVSGARYNPTVQQEIDTEEVGVKRKSGTRDSWLGTRDSGFCTRALNVGLGTLAFCT